MDLNGLPAELEQFVQQEIAEGKYQSTEEVVNAALRLLQEHESQGHHGQQPANGHGVASLRSADEVVQAIHDALATGHYVLARELAMDGAKTYPDHHELQKFGHILAPPTVGELTPTTAETRAARKANHAWLKSHWQACRGQWIALRAGELLHASPSMDDLITEVGAVRGPDLLLTKIA
jgi:putative addiction module CopG family antidote